MFEDKIMKLRKFVMSRLLMDTAKRLRGRNMFGEHTRERESLGLLIG